VLLDLHLGSVKKALATFEGHLELFQPSVADAAQFRAFGLELTDFLKHVLVRLEV